MARLGEKSKIRQIKPWKEHMMDHPPIAIAAAEAARRAKASNYPEPFASMVAGRIKQPLGEAFGLTAFGVNRTTLVPGAVSSLHHSHSREDEMIYILEGHPTLVSGATEVLLHPGMCAGFAHGGPAHHLKNNSAELVVYLEIGNRAAGDEVTYPNDDLRIATGKNGERYVAHKNGDPY
jgi:uncharacterized cupin superfamily protein